MVKRDLKEGKVPRWFKILLAVLTALILVVAVVGAWFWQTAINGKRYLILLQNTDEIRATGGFIGSYAVLDFKNAEPFDLTLRDMYDPSGISVTQPSPPGHKEYLGEDEGMRLIDANWSPDFPTSAQQILSYFQAIPTDRQDFDGVVAVPLTTVEKMVELLGGLYVADEEQTVTAETLASLIRQDRDQFFPGSQEKAQVLQRFYTAMKLLLAELSAWDKWQLWHAARKSGALDEVQIYVQKPRLEKIIERLGWSGALKKYQLDELYLMPVESNVGINKANRKVSRELTTELTNNQLMVTTVFHNSYTAAERPTQPLAGSAYDVAPHLAYVNYYRLLVRPDLTVNSIKVDGQAITQWDDDSITSAAGLEYRQIGFLVVTLEEASSTAEVSFNLPALSAKPNLIFQKQIGLTYQSINHSIE